MKHYYNSLIVWLIIADIFLLVIFGILITTTLVSQQYNDLFTIIPLFFVFTAFFAGTEIFLIKYYANIVISVEFSGEDIILITNTKRHQMPVKYISEVKEIPSLCRTYIKYNNGGTKKQFTYVMRYALKTRHLNFEEMKRHMPYTKFDI